MQTSSNAKSSAEHSDPPTSPDLHPDWLNSPEAAQAKRVSGWPDCSAEDFLRALALVVDTISAGQPVLDAELRKRGLSYDECCRMIADVKMDHALSVDQSVAERYAIRRFYLAGIGEDHIAALLGLPEADVTDYMRKKKMSPAWRAAIALHLEGRSVQEIAKGSGVPRYNVYRMLEDLGLVPNRERTLLDEATKVSIVARFRAGGSYAQIQAELSVEKYQVTNTLRAAHARGECPEYGHRRAA